MYDMGQHNIFKCVNTMAAKLGFEKEIKAVESARTMDDVEKALIEFKQAVKASPEKATKREKEKAEDLPDRFKNNAQMIIYLDDIVSLLYESDSDTDGGRRRKRAKKTRKAKKSKRKTRKL